MRKKTLGPDIQRDETESAGGGSDGMRAELDGLSAVVYDDLRRLAHRQLQQERSDHTLNTTALVHECYLRLVDQNRSQWQDQRHFLAIAATAMRRILVDYARQHQRKKRGGGQRRLSLDDVSIPVEDRADVVVALNDALEKLEAMNPRLCRVVECRFFAGMTEAETASVLQVTARTVARDWVKARAWLYRELGEA
jgi:RNA polymerase sigma factor (TIGR02999 family)